jgi:hypothetical protein
VTFNTSGFLSSLTIAPALPADGSLSRAADARIAGRSFKLRFSRPAANVVRFSLDSAAPQLVALNQRGVEAEYLQQKAESESGAAGNP